MKRFFLLFSLVIMCVCVAMAQAPEKMTYQAVVRNSANLLVANQNVTVRLSILQGSAQGAPVYVENHTAATNDNGLMTVEIGGGAPTTGVFANIDWANGPYFLKSEIDPTGGINYSIESVQQLMSVPYALYAKEAGNGFSGDYNDLTNKPTFTESQILSISNDTIYLTGGSFVKLPAGFDGDYNSLTNRPNLFSGAYNDLTGKPNLAPVATSGEYNDLTGKPNLAPVATSGNYNDLTYKPTLFDGNYNSLSNRPILFSGNYNDLTNKPNLFDGDYNSLTNRPNLAPVAISGNYNDLLNKPVLFDGNYNSLTNRPNLAPVATSGNYSDLTNKPNLATVATSGSYNDLSNRPAIPAEQVNADWNATSGKAQIINKPNLAPVATSGSYNDITGKPNLAPVATSGNYNDLTNRPQIPTVPTNVSAFTNDAGYITMDSIPTIPTIPTNVSTFQNDAGYITHSAVPTNVSQLQNDAGYITSFTEQQILTISNDTIYLTGGSYVKLPTGFDGDYNSLTNKPTIPIVPTDVSAFQNDAGYITQAAVPTNVSQLQNDAGYLTSFTESQILTISNDTIYLTGGSYVKLPAGFDGDYNSLTNKPTIPIVPTDVSAFTNDAGYITQVAVPTHVSQLQNDAGYLTSFTEQQILTISNDTIYLTGGSFVKLPAGFDGDYNSLTNKPNLAPVATTGSYNDIVDKPNLAPVATSGNYNDLTNRPQIPTVPTNVSAFTNDAGYITQAAVPTNVSAFQNDAGYLTSFTEQQVLSISNDTIYLTGGSFVKLPAGFNGDYNSLTNKPNLAPVASSGSYNDITGKPNLAPVATSGDYNDLTNRPTIPAAQVNSDWNATSGVEEILNKPTNVSAFTNDAGYLTSDSLANLNNQLDSLQQALNNLQQIMEDDHFLCGTSTVTDVDGNTYNTVRIGEQCWMRENLRTTHYADGTDIPLGTDTSSTIPYRYNPDNNASNVPIYGYLYNWPALMHGEASSKSNPSGVQGICPDGWHVPSEAEWNQLTTAVSNYNGFICSDDIGNIAKALSDTIGWYNSDITPNYHAYDCVVGNDLSANNATGFSALPAGKFYVDYSYFGRETRFWCTNQAMDSYAMCKYLYYNGAVVYGAGNPKSFGFSVRCLRDSRSVGDYLQGVSEQIEAQREQIETQQSEVLCPSTVTDVDGNTYNIVRIGEQCWMRENLRTTRYADGTAIPFGGTSLSSVTPYRYVPNNDENNVVTYGYLYNWPAVMHGAASSSTNPSGVQGICPTGWHVPSTAEWDQLTTMVSRHREYICDGNPTNCAKALSATTGWNNSTYDCVVGNDLSANNATGFSALPAGGSHSRSRLFGEVAYFWSSTQYTVSSAYNRYLSNIDSFVGESYQDEFLGLSVRCLRDNRSVGDYLQGLGEQIEAQQHILDSLAPVAFSGDYNDLINTPPIPAEQVNADWNATSGKAEILNKPTNVSAFANDAGYITMDSIPAIPTIPTNVSAFINDAGYVTVANVQQAANIPTNVSAFTNDAGYITMDSIPSIPTIPTNVSAFQNDAGYLTSFTEQQILSISNDTIYLTGGSYVKLPAGFDGDYNSLTNKPNLAPVATTGSYNDIVDKPNLAPVATSGNYNDLTNRPQIPTVPTNVSAFTNDAGYITQAAVPTNVSAFQNDAGYLTSFTEQQILTISNDTIYLTGGSYVKLPAGFDGDYNSLTNKPNLAPVATSGSYNDITNKPNLAPVATSGDYNSLTNKPTIPIVPTDVSVFNNDAGYITQAAVPTNVSQLQNDAGYLTSFTEQQILTISNDTIYLTGGSFVKLPAGFDGDYNSLTNKPTIPIVPTDVSAFTNDAGYITQAAVPTNVSAFTNDVGYVTQMQFNNANYITNTGSSCDNSVDLCNLLRRLDSVESRLQNMTAHNNTLGYGMPLNDTCPQRMIMIHGAHNVCYYYANNVFLLAYVDGVVDEADYVWYRNGQLANNQDAIAFANLYAEEVSPTYSDPVKYTVKVTTADGCSYLSAPFEVNVYDPPYTIITGDSNICVGESVTLRANIQNSNNPMITFQWYENGVGNANRLSGRTHETETFTPSSGTTTYYVEVTHLMNADVPCVAYDMFRVHVDSCGANGGGNGGGETSATLPTVSTGTVSDITVTTATCGGTVTSDGGASVTARGVCWSTSQNPTINNNHTSNGNGTGSFASSVTGLTAGTTYYVRAYATNSKGTAYGTQRSFTTTSSLPTVTTNSTSNITSTTATCGGTVTFDGGASVTARGVCWSTSQNPTINNNHTSDGNGTGSFTSSVTGLTAGTTYYVRAYATNSKGTAYGTQRSFTTTSSLPTVTTNSTSNITSTTATCGGTVTFDGGASVTARGVCWSTSQNPTINNNHTSDGNGIGSFTSSMAGLSAGTTYYVRAYATNSNGTSYGNNVSFTTDNPPVDGQPCPNAATVSDYDGNSYNTVQIGDQCWMKENLRTTHYATGTSITQGSTSQSSNSTRYYYNPGNGQAFGYLYNWPATIGPDNVSVNNQGICPSGWHVPGKGEWTQLINYVSNQNLYICNNNSEYVAKALASTTGWSSSSSNECYVGNTQSNNNATGFNALPTGLYTRSGTFDQSGILAGFWTATVLSSSRASNVVIQSSAAVVRQDFDASVGSTSTYKEVGYSVRCLRDEGSSNSLPTLTTNEVTAVTTSSATSGGYISSTGTSTVTSRGVCWSTSHNPTINNGHTVDGVGTGSFTSNITGLSAGTTYYVRAYAVNSAGISYGGEMSFTTLTPSLPTLTTTSVTSITNATASSGGNITSSGGSAVTARGVCWSTSHNPTLNNSHTSDGMGIGSYTSNISELTSGTTYYVRAYAVNEVGVSYGNELSFTTLSPFVCGSSTASDYEGHIYHTVQIGSQCWMKENLRTSHYSNGTSITQGSTSQASTTTRYYYNPGNGQEYGYLYNWPAAKGIGGVSANNQGVCPSGWHVPSDAEWTQLTQYVGNQSLYCCSNNSSYVAKALASTSGWESYSSYCSVGYAQNINNNATGFSVVPAGYFCINTPHINGEFYEVGENASFWSCTQSSSTEAYGIELNYDDAFVNRDTWDKSVGNSVRCLRDN